MSWDNTYLRDKRVWGDRPSELAVFAAERIKLFPAESRFLLDVGCGYGRDALYLSAELHIDVLGIDCSKSAIEMGNASLPPEIDQKPRFLCADFDSLTQGPFDVIFASNLYQVLGPGDRSRFRAFVKKSLKSNGTLFLGTMSTGDPEHFGKGAPVQGDNNSFEDEKYLHFSNRQELEQDFGFLTIQELIEHEFFEPRSNGTTHHHKSWLLMSTHA
jgi:cyclopropane fatty-acyl-phospholipid synthase-like methyltransferase